MKQGLCLYLIASRTIMTRRFIAGFVQQDPCEELAMQFKSSEDEEELEGTELVSEEKQGD